MERDEAFTFRTPCSILIVGPSGCGKTCFTASLLLDHLEELFATPPETVHYCYGAWQDGFAPMKKGGVKFHEGAPSTSQLQTWFPNGGLLVLDDLMEEGGNDKRVLDLFTKHSHHRNITVLYLCQDMFPPGKYTPRAFPEMLITSWLLRILAINWAQGIYCCKRFRLVGKM